MREDIRAACLCKRVRPEAIEKLTAYRFSIISWTANALCIAALSITTTEFGPGYGFMLSRSPLIKLLNDLPVYGFSWMVKWMMPLSESAGRIEYLQWRCDKVKTIKISHTFILL